MPMRNDQFEKLPELLEEIAGVAGLAAALAVARARGGQAVYFPDKRLILRGGGKWLVEAVGKEIALKIADAMIPVAHTVLIPRGPEEAVARRLQIEALALSGVGADQIAGQVSCHRRTVERVRAKLKKKGSL